MNQTQAPANTISKNSLPPIISPEQAAAGSDAGNDYVWCDVRWYLDGRSGYDAYLAEHIDGAIFVDLDEHLADPPSKQQGRHPLPSGKKFAQTLGELGISEHDLIVAYDDAGGVSAGRCVWMLRTLGYQAALLDGGLQAWPGELSSSPTKRPPTEVPVREWPADLLADADYTAAHAHSVVLADARPLERFRGEVEPMDARPGHIPGAVNLAWDGNLDSEGRFLSSEELRQRFESVGISSATSSTEDAPIMYCGSGVSACHNLLALEHAGLNVGARLYPGSWSQWSAQPDRPAEQGDPST